MIGKVSIKKVSNITGEEELLFEGQNQITEGLKHAIVNVLTGTGSNDIEDYQFRYYQLGDEKYDLSTYDISADVTSSSFKSYFWTIKSPLTSTQYGLDSKYGISTENTYVLGSIFTSGLGTTKTIDNFVQPPDYRTINNEYSNQFALQAVGQFAGTQAPMSVAASSTWITGCADTWVADPRNSAIPPLSSYQDFAMSGPDFKSPVWAMSYTPDRYLVDLTTSQAAFNQSCIRANHSYVYKGNAGTHKKGEPMEVWTKLQENQTFSEYFGGVHYLSGVVDNTVSATPLTGRLQIFNRYAQTLISTGAGQNRNTFLYRYDYDDVDITYTPIILDVSSGWQNNEVDSSKGSLTDFSSIYGLSSEEEYGVVSGNVYNRYGPVYTYADHLTGYTTSSGDGAPYLDTANAGFGPSGNFYRVSVSWANAPSKMINYYKGYASKTELFGQGLVPFSFPIVSSVSGADITLDVDGQTPLGHEWPETTPRAKAYVSYLQWDYSPSVGPNQNVHGEQSYYLTYPQSFVYLPEYYISAFPKTANSVRVRVGVGENLANSQTIREVGLFLKNPSGAVGRDAPFLAAYKLLPCDINKTAEFSYLIDWELSFIDISVPNTEQSISEDGCTSS